MEPNKIYCRNNQQGKTIGGLLLVVVGLLFLLKETGVFIFPSWTFSWPMLMIVFGVFIGLKHRFRRPSWIAFVLIGGLFLFSRIYPEYHISNQFWPVVIIVIGLMMIFKPKHRRREFSERWKERYEGTETFSSEDRLDSVTVLGGIKKNILSKDFKGGEITTVLGGAEINLSQADINGRITLEITQVMGGTKLIVPSNWKIESEMVSILGGLDDKRARTDGSYDPDKVLIIQGTTVMGGLEIRTY